MNRKTMLSALLAAGCASVAHADILWDQSAHDPLGAGFWNTISGDPPFGITGYTVADVTVPAGGWTINSVTMYFSNLDSFGGWENDVTEGRLYIQPKSGALPTVLPGGPLIPMSALSLGASYAVTASGLSNVLAAGEYWIGITPAAPSGFFGPELGLATTGAVIGDPSATYDLSAPPWAAPNGADAAILVQGVPAPASAAVLGLGGLLISRRRRA